MPYNSRDWAGPLLTGFAERQYIAGSLVNVPTNAMNWIMNPQKYKPDAAMPKLDVKLREAADIAAYLYTLGSRKRIEALRRTSIVRNDSREFGRAIPLLS